MCVCVCVLVCVRVFVQVCVCVCECVCEADNHLINDCSKLAWKEYKINPDWIEKIIHWELRKRVNFA